MAIDYSGLFGDFETLANDLIDHVNAATITAVWKEPGLQTGPANLEGQPDTVNYLGGRQPLDSLDGRLFEAGSNLQEASRSDSFKVRRYWEPKGMDKELATLKIDNPQDVCKIISYVANRQSLLNATHIVVDDYKCIMIRGPLPHGLGGSLYDTSWWVISRA